MAQQAIILQVKWGSNTIMLSVAPSETVGQVKSKLQAQTQVAPANQKIMGWLPKGKIPEDKVRISELNLKSPHKLMLMGTAKKELEKQAELESEYRDNAEIERALERERLEEMEKEEEERRRHDAELRARYEAQQREREEQWRREQEARRRQYIEDQMQMEVDSTATLNLSITCHSIAFATKIQPNPTFEFSDKIILPNSVLEEIVQKRLELPLTFKISTIHSAHITHAGVLDFTAPEDTAYLPYWMMKKLSLDEGDNISLNSVKLPKGNFVKLKPETSNWKDMPSREHLEQQLRNYQALTTNDVIKIQINGRAYDLRVEAVRAEGEEEKVEENKEETDAKIEKTPTEEDRGIGITNTDLNVDLEGLQVGVKQEDLELGEDKEGSVNKDEYVYYTIILPEYIGGGYVIELKPSSGDPDLYISTKERNPTQHNFTWASQHKGSKRLVISTQDSKFTPGRYFIGVHGFQSDAKFSISVSLNEENDGQILGGTTTTTTDTQNANMSVCPNCQRAIPASALVLHEAQCMRRNFRCTQCGAVMPIDQKDKHLAVAHSKLRCECGAEFEQDLLPLHKEFECPKRLVKCVFCGMELPYNERYNHQNDCGGRTATCPHCKKIFKRRDMKTHIVEEHQVFPDENEFFV
eukprot:Phypoly_transcript_05404.p1 GENE.Phypoly_transcript_05404~~Phypoly_transcript_05404.p1  ORF type:complete len:647 (-),score=125.54 Phypoly_transcript_05404:29-1945(-)